MGLLGPKSNESPNESSRPRISGSYGSGVRSTQTRLCSSRPSRLQVKHLQENHFPALHPVTFAHVKGSQRGGCLLRNNLLKQPLAHTRRVVVRDMMLAAACLITWRMMLATSPPSCSAADNLIVRWSDHLVVDYWSWHSKEGAIAASQRCQKQTPDVKGWQFLSLKRDPCVPPTQSVQRRQPCLTLSLPA